MLSLPTVAPPAGTVLLAYTLAGCGLGCCSGLVPGLHANNFAFLLAAAAPALDAAPIPLGCAMVAAGVVHTFLDVVPSLALGVPDAAMAAAALPGHTLVAEGRGREAMRLSAVGSGLALAIAVPAAAVITAGMRVAYPHLRAWLPVVLAAVALLLVLTESSNRRRIAGAVSFALATALGLVVLDAPTDPLVSAGGTLTPLFAGLFGVPMLAGAGGGVGVPAVLPPLLSAVAIAGGVGAVAVVLLGDAALGVVGRLPHAPLVAAVLAGLALLSVGFAGAFGLAVLVAAAAVGFVLVRLGCRRVHLMGVLLGPLVIA